MIQGALVPRQVRIGLLLSTGLVLLSLAAIVALRWGPWSRPALPVFGQVPPFELVDQQGRPASDADLAGRVHLVGFIYTSCPDVCPAITAEMAAMQEQLAHAGLSEKVHLLSITVDPEYDTPERLDEYARAYGADTSTWRFLTGEPHHVRAVVEKGFLVGMEQVSTGEAVHAGHAGRGGAEEPDYRVEHGGRVALVDQKAQIRAYHDGNRLDPDGLMAQIRLLLAGR